MKKKRARKVTKLLSLALSTAMVFQTGNLEAREATLDVGETDELETSDVARTSGRENPANPVHHCGLDGTTFSYVYFGNYPQTRVTDEEMTVAILSASYDENGDAVADGQKYRRMEHMDSDSGESEYRYYKWEPIKWKVLQKEDGTLFLLADQALDNPLYGGSDSSTWEWYKSDIRRWMNQDFYETAFDSKEREAIVEWELINPDLSYVYDKTENDTVDKVYLLSSEDAVNPEYGFCEGKEVVSASRKAYSSDYADEIRGYSYVFYGEKYPCDWWLRDAGQYSTSIKRVDSDGEIRDGGITRYKIACVPALHLDVSSDVWTAADGGGEGALSNPVHHCSEGGPDSTDYSYIYFGSYPQGRVEDEEVTDAVIEADYDAKGDAWVGPVKYRRVVKSDAGNTGSAATDKYAYYKWERIKWRVLQNDGSRLFVMADCGLDAQSCNDVRNWYQWKNSKIRNWLNGEFCGMAFSGEEQAAIENHEVVNKDNPKYGTPGGETTRDKLFLLSYEEATNLQYGFCGDISFNYRNIDYINASSRYIWPSDYASRRIGDTMMKSRELASDSPWETWLLRTPGDSASHTMFVRSDGTFRHALPDYPNIDSLTPCECVPALYLDISSELWQSEDDGTSGAGGNDGVLRDPPKQPQQETPENPIHRCSKDVTDYSHVYFGSYPQSEVSGAALTPAITGASYDENGDARVDGVKYRRISKGGTENDSNFGEKEYRYFKWEPLKWRVLQNDGSKLFVMADRGIDCKKYQERDLAATWETCSLRKWLNEDFYQAAFDADDRTAILKQYLVQENDSQTGVSGGNDTKDNVFLLAEKDVKNEKYGFCQIKSSSRYIPDISINKYMRASEYAFARGVTLDSIYVEEGVCGWWTRRAGLVNGNSAVVPALCLDLSSNSWTLADNAGGKEDTPSNPVHHCDNNVEGSYFDCIYFGSYPQSRVSRYELTAEIVDAPYDKRGDAWVNGVKYRRTGHEPYYYYFKWERIRWRVLQNDGDTLLVSADLILDDKPFYTQKEHYTWDKSELRKWLNGEFCGTAFSEAEQKEIVKQNLVNEDNFYRGTEGGADTEDYVFLLSFRDVTNPQYGFCWNHQDLTGRDLPVSDYADDAAEVGNDGYWWLRSPGYSKYDVECISRSLKWIYDYYGGQGRGIAPALRLKLSNDFWASVDDGTSGEGGNGGTSIFKISVSSQETGQSGGQNSGQTSGGASGSKPGGAANQNTGSGSQQSGGSNGGTPSKTSKIKVPAISISGKVKAKSRGFTVKWKKKKSVSGYQIQYSTSKKFTKKTTKTKTVKKASQASLTVKKLKANKTYYVRVRTYKIVNGKQDVSKWSKTARVKTKK